MSKIGLVLEGGGLRGAYTAGVLSWFIDHNIEVDFAVGISSGAMHLCNYLNKEKNKLYGLSVTWAGSKRNIGISSILHEGRYVGYDYIFDEVLKDIMPIDLNQLRKTKVKAEIGVYDLEYGETFWKNVQEMDDTYRLLKAACTLPIAGRIVDFEGRRYLDGGITTMIPINRSVHYGCDKHIVITTKPAGFKRKPSSKAFEMLMRMNYPKYPKLIEDLKQRADVYYREVSIIEKLSNEGKCLQIFPTRDVGIARFSGDPEKLKELFELGRSDCELRKEEIFKYIK